MYCRNCAYQLNDNSPVCPHCQMPVGQGNSYCAACGNQVGTSDGYCGKCGAKLKNEYGGHVEQKSRIAAGILGILLGWLGVHNFYLGFTSRAVLQLLLTVLSCGTLAIIPTVWGIVEGVMILTNPNSVDANGVPLRD